jgi:hypothetical protein
MAKITNQLNDYYKNKTIQRAYGFVVSFVLPYNEITENITSKNSSLSRFLDQGERFPIKPYHIKNVVFPRGSYKKEIQKFGNISKTFPVYETDGHDIRIEMEEDQHNNISLFIEFLQKLIIDEYGYYNYPSKNRLDIIIDVVDDNYNKVLTYKYKEGYFLDATETTLDYSTNEPISYTITFGSDLYETQVHNRPLRRLI